MKNQKRTFLLIAFFLFFVFSSFFLSGNFALAAQNPCNDYTSWQFLSGWCGIKHVGSAVSGAAGDTLSVAARVVGNPLLWVINLLLYALSVFLWLFVLLAGVIFDWAINPNNFFLVTGNNAIYTGWTTVRDFFNIFFILILIFSAFATIFQVEKFHLKRTLLMLVLMALLVNFSWPIARLIIDSGNVVMYFFIEQGFPQLSNKTSNLSATLTQFSDIDTTLNPASTWTEKILTPEVVTVKLLLGILFTFLFSVTLCAIAVLLVVRIVMLAVLLVFAPIGFIGAILPSTQRFSSMWWENIFKQSLFGPIMIFMIILSIRIMTEIGTQLRGGIETLVTSSGIDGTYSKLIVFGTYLSIPITLLWAGLISAQKIGAAGSGLIVGKASSLGKWGLRTLTGYRLASWGLERFGHKLDRDIAQGKFLGFGGGERMQKIGKWLSPSAIKRGFEERAKRHEEEAISTAAGSVHDALNKIFRDHEPEDYYQGLAKDRLVAAKKKQLTEVTEVSKRLLDMISKDIGSEDLGALTRVRAVLESVVKNKDADEFFDFVKHNYDKPILAGGKSFKDLKIATEVSNYNMGDAVRKILHASGVNMDSNEAKEIAGDIGEFGIGIGSVGGYGIVYFDDTERKFKWIEEHSDVKSGKVTAQRQQAIYTMGKMKTTGEVQNVPKIFHRNLLVDESGNIDTDMFHSFVTSGLAESILPHANRFRSDFYTSFMKSKDKFQGYVNSGAFGDVHDKEAAQAFINSIEDYTSGNFKADKYKITPRKTTPPSSSPKITTLP